MINFIKKEHFNIGLVLHIFAIAMSNLISLVNMRDYSIFTNFFLILGLILIMDFDSFFKNKISVNKTKFILFFFILSFTFLSTLRVPFVGSNYAIIYNLYTLIMSSAILVHKDWEHKEDFIRILFYSSGILTLISFVPIRSLLAGTSSIVNGIYDQSGKLIADRLSLTSIPLISIISCICYNQCSKKEKILKVLFFVAAVFVFLPLFRRGPSIELALATLLLLLYGFNFTKRIKKKSLISALVSIFLIIIVLFILSYNNEFMLRIDNLFLSIKRALLTLFGNTDTYGIDASASSRYYSRMLILNEYESYTFWEILFGKGYMYKYLDFPLFQIFIDLGIVGGIFYVIVLVGNCLKRILKKPKNDIEKFLLFEAVMILCRSFYCGIPYSWSTYFIISVLVLYSSQEKSKISSPKNNDNS